MKTIINFLTILAIIFAIFLIGPEVEGKLLPVLKDYEPVSVTRIDDDILIEGKIRKARNCEYIHPWRAKTLVTGRTLMVRINEIDKPNWAKGLVQFTPIVVINAGIEDFVLYAEHKCHPGWNTFSHITTVTGVR